MIIWSSRGCPEAAEAGGRKLPGGAGERLRSDIERPEAPVQREVETWSLLLKPPCARLHVGSPMGDGKGARGENESERGARISSSFLLQPLVLWLSFDAAVHRFSDAALAGRYRALGMSTTRLATCLSSRRVCASTLLSLSRPCLCLSAPPREALSRRCCSPLFSIARNSSLRGFQ